MKKAIIDKIKKRYPELPSQLITAGMNDLPEEFIKKCMVGAAYVAGLVTFILILLATKNPNLWIFAGLSPFVVFAGVFMFNMKLPEVKINTISKEINKEIVYAGRFLIIELESGVPLYNAMINVSDAYPGIGKHFRELVNKIDFGTSMEDAINEAIMYSPSTDFKRILWQILNALNTGSDIHKSLDNVVEQIVREQVTLVKKYAKKLNPLAMFYMMIAVIVPTLGIAMGAVATNFIAIEVTRYMLLGVVAGIAFVQIMFLNIIKSQRPAVAF
jgi:flagellar protein FlaJ